MSSRRLLDGAAPDPAAYADPGSLGAVPLPDGVHLDSRRALEEMALAAGFRVPPPLHVIDTPALNAFVLGHDPASAVVGVTSGLAEALTLPEQRAVFGDLLARVTAIAAPSSDALTLGTPAEIEAADLEAVRLCGEPAALLSALTKVLRAPNMPPGGWALGPWVWFGHHSALDDAAVRLGEHPRIRRLRQVLGVAGVPETGA